MDPRIIRIRSLYLLVLGREPDLAGIKAALELGLDDESFEARLRRCEERHKIVRSAFKAMLGRDPNPIELELWSLAPLAPSRIAVELAANPERVAWVKRVQREVLGFEDGALTIAYSLRSMSEILNDMAAFMTTIGRDELRDDVAQGEGPSDVGS